MRDRVALWQTVLMVPKQLLGEREISVNRAYLIATGRGPCLCQFRHSMRLRYRPQHRIDRLRKRRSPPADALSRDELREERHGHYEVEVMGPGDNFRR